jgi:arylsulfatase A-like enzyme
MKAKRIIAAVLVGILFSATAEKRPNILFVVTDDQDFATIGAYGGKVLTPNIDRLAAEGMRCDRAYCTTSSCAPSRYAIMTGRLAGRCSADEFIAKNAPGEQAYITNDAIVLEPGRPTLPQVLRAGGYRTGFVGKWHLGPHHNSTIGIQTVSKGRKLGEPEVDATLRGNQQKIAAYFKTLGFDATANVYWDNIGEWAGHVDGLTAQNMEWTVDGALKFLDGQDDRPFFLWFAPLQMHNPCGAVKEFAPLVGSELITPAGLLEEPPQVQPPRATISERLRAAGIPDEIPQSKACVKYGTEYTLWLDDGIGAILDRLDEMGVAENTLVVFFSDNATWGKFHTYERGCNVPLILRWPGKIAEGSVSDALIANVDFAPTALAAAGLDVPDDLGTDGVSQLPLLTGEKQAVRETVMLEFGASRSVCDGRWKYIAIRHTEKDRAFAKKTNLQPGHWGAGETAGRFKGLLGWRKWHEKNYPAYYDFDQLYDLENDPQEQNNLAANPECADVLVRMKKMMADELQDMPRPFGEFKGDRHEL